MSGAGVLRCRRASRRLKPANGESQGEGAGNGIWRCCLKPNLRNRFAPQQQPATNSNGACIPFADLAGMEVLKAELSAQRHQAIHGVPPRRSCGRSQWHSAVRPTGLGGKTAFAMAIAGELQLRVVKVSGVDLASKWVNESGTALKSLFSGQPSGRVSSSGRV